MNRAYLVALQKVNGLGPIRLKNLVDYFGDAKSAWEARRAELVSLKLPGPTIENLQELKRSLNPGQYLELLLKKEIKILTIYDQSYPKLLKEIYDPPVVLFYKGEIPQSNALGIVGTRKVTSYGKLVTDKFASELSQAGLVIVSGLARGVDSIAHQATISQKGKTIAILGGGIFKIFPPENERLAESIASGFGAVISEFAPDEPHLPGNFPARNRIISAFSLGVLITEAAVDSGSMITARCALEQGREVFAIPGPINSFQSEGTNNLIKNGAKLVTKTEEILEELGIRATGQKPKALSLNNLSETEKRILDSLIETKHLDQISRELNFTVAEVSASLIKMEIRGIVKNMGGGNYIRG